MPREDHIVRILSGRGGIAGVGFFVTSQQLLTCAHVVNFALGREPYEQSHPPKESKILVEFPFDPQAPAQEARVVGWEAATKLTRRCRDSGGDIATLEIQAARPPAVGFSLMSGLRPIAGRPVEAFGYPGDSEIGVWAEGSISGRTETGWFQLNGDDARPDYITQGFSGGPVCEYGTDTVVGMVVRADTRGSRRSYMIPAQMLKQRIRVARHRGSIGWAIHYLRTCTLAALLTDLAAAERQGFEDDACDQVKTVLAVVAHHDPENPLHSIMYAATRSQFETFLRVYDEWNGPGHNAQFAGLRREKLKELRSVREAISRKIIEDDGVFADVLDWRFLDAIHREIPKTCGKHPEKFRHLITAGREYFKRKEYLGPGATGSSASA
ncbi:MAG: trypsin-like peptidase domain-containing protein [Armatimonadetes bacterium]|nr:trypsin-like peptidase domain-containing protein [Armatimonadota bacterium]